MKNTISRYTMFLLYVVAVLCSLSEPSAQTFQPNWKSLGDNYKFPAWYRDAKLGIMLHWGPYSVANTEWNEWYAKEIYYQDGIGADEWGKGAYAFHREKFGHPSEVGYKDVAHQWKVDKWNPDSLCALFKSIGAGYIQPVGNHHDGFDTWNSTYQKWNAYNVGPKRDLAKEWAVAARKLGLRFGLSVHKVDWAYGFMTASHGADLTGTKKGIKYDGVLTKADGKGKWWDGLDPQELYTTGSANTAAQLKWQNEMNEAITNYKLDLLWFDGGLSYSSYGLNVAAHLYNTNPEAALIIKSKSYDMRAYVYTLEKGQSATIKQYPFETHYGISGWFYHTGQTACKLSKLITNYVDVVSKNGTFLLNAALHADGELSEVDRPVLLEIGNWNRINGEGIFATRPFAVYGEGPTVIVEQGWSDIVDAFTPKDVRFTRNKAGTTLYVFLLGWPGNGAQSTIASLASGKLDTKNLTGVTMLGGTSCVWSQNTSGLTITMPPAKPAGVNYAYGFKLAFSSVIVYDGKAIETYPFETQVGETPFGMTNASKRQCPRVILDAAGPSGPVIRYYCETESEALLEIVTLNGRIAATRRVSGSGVLTLAPSELGKGIYLYRLAADNASHSGMLGSIGF